MLAARQPSGRALLRRSSCACGAAPATARPPVAMLGSSRVACLVRAGLGSYLQRHTVQLR